MNTNVLNAVFKRNFVSYFANPTGYVFICVFVLLSSLAAFWPYEFFNANLANLDQLNRYFALIMLVFIPAITMSVWADERRQGTDELLLTVPAGDFEIVLGKYLAAVAIYNVSLLFSLVCNYGMLWWLSEGNLDGGLFLGTYVGYWLVGLAMLAIAMVASFLTSNLTVAFILGAVFNAPLVAAVWADSVFGPTLALELEHWSVGEQFRDFGRGIISLSGITYFVMVMVVMLYASMVLIGRRHWLSGRRRRPMVAHYLARAVALVVIAVGLCIFFEWHDLRGDVTSEKLSSLSSHTRKLLKDLDVERPVQIEAFITPSVPESYVQTRLNLLAMLDELDALGGEKVEVRVHDTERFSEEAAQAEQRYGISPRRVEKLSRGAYSLEHIFMHVAVSCGLQKVDPVFFDRGIPAEYELARSIATVSRQKRKRIGVIATDAQLYGRFNMQTMSPGSNWPIIDELEKQYEVEEVDLSNPITEQYDALLAVQPSSLGPEQMDHFVAAIQSGQPTAIFEDPMPFFAGWVPGTSEDRRPPGGMNPMFGRQPPPPKCKPETLWDALGVIFDDQQVIWQDYNPHYKVREFPKEFVFVDQGAVVERGKGSRESDAEGTEKVFNQSDPISSKLQHMLFPFPGSVIRLPSSSSSLEFTPLVRTGNRTGTVPFSQIMTVGFPFFGSRLNPARQLQFVYTGDEYVLAAHIRSKTRSDQKDADEKAKVPANDEAAADDETSTDDKARAEGAFSADAASETEEAKDDPSEINVVLVADIDMLSRDFFRLREQGEVPGAGIHFDFDNVPFVLNVLDALAGDHRFLELRKRRPLHRTLTRIEERTEEARDKATDAREKFIRKCKEGLQREQDAFDKKIKGLENRKNVDPQQMLIEVALARQAGQRRLDAETERLERERDTAINKIETELALETRRVQDSYKMRAVLLPPILPLVLAVIVFVNRRVHEREGVARTRLR